MKLFDVYRKHAIHPKKPSPHHLHRFLLIFKPFGK